MKTKIIQIILVATAILALLIVLPGRYPNLHVSSRLMLMIASTCFVLIGLTSFLEIRGKYGLFVFIGLIFCWFGDYLGNFKMTVIAFLLAHFSFILAFAFRGVKRIRLLKALPTVLVAGGIICYWLYPHIPQTEWIFIIGYIIIISAMVIFAFGTQPRCPIIVFAAILFYISDIFVARWRFVDTGSINAFFCYPLYYTSCILFAFSNRK